MAAVKLTGNFLATARCLIFADGGGIVWTFNSNTNTLQASGSGGGVTGLATPTGTVGLATVAGIATTAMRSDAAPPLSQAIIPTWTGLHTFSAGLTVSAGTVTIGTRTLALSANATVGGTNTGDQTLPVGANPTASTKLSAVNGSAATFMRSDGAPPLDVTIVPVWTGAHTFQPSSAVTAVTITGFGAGNNALIVDGNGATETLVIKSNGTNGPYMDFYGGAGLTRFGLLGSAAALSSGGTTDFCISTGGATSLMLATNFVNRLTLSSTGGIFSVPIGVNGNSAPAKVTGWGTPTGQTVVNNFAAGAGTSVLQMSEAIAQIITDLKAFGLYGA